MDLNSVTEQMRTLKQKAQKARAESKHLVARTFARGAARLSRRLKRAAQQVKAAGKKAEAES